MFFTCIAVIINTIGVTGDNVNQLLGISVEKFRLHFERYLELVDYFDLSTVKIHFKYAVFFAEDYVFYFCFIFEVKLGTHFIEKFNILDNYFVVKFEFVFWATFNPFENEELVMFLFIFDKIFATDAAEQRLAVRILHTNNLIGLSSHRIQQCYGYRVNLNKLFRVIYDNFVDFTDQKSIHGAKFEAKTTLKVLFDHRYPKIVCEFTGPDVKVVLIGFIGDTVLYLRPKHHLVAIHEVKHNVI